MNDDYLKLICSERVSLRTREVLLNRSSPQAVAEAATFLPSSTFAVLGAVVDRLIPQAKDSDFIDVARVLDWRKHQNLGDGWRFANMPPDAIAFEAGLNLLEATAQRLHDMAFTSLGATEQDALLRQVQRGEVFWPTLDGRRWFEEVLADATEIYVSHISTLAQIGFSGVAFLPAWAEVGLHTTQSWEPVRR